MQISWSYNDSDFLRSSWFLSRIGTQLPDWACGNCYTRSERGEASLRIFLDSRSAKDHLLVSLLENDINCADVENTMRIHPGVGIYFDLNFSSMALQRFAYSTSGADANAVFKKTHPKAPPIGDYQARSWPTASFARAFPLSSPAFDDTLVAFVFTEAQKRSAQKAAPEHVVEMLPLPLAILPEETVQSEASVLRQILGFRPSDIVLGVTSDSSTLSAAEQLLQALLACSDPRLKCLWLVHEAQAEILARRALAKFGLESRASIQRLDSQEEWSAFHSAFDVACYLDTDPLAGPTLSQLISLERGIPLLVTKIGFGADLGPGQALALSPDRYLEGTLQAGIEQLAANQNFLPALKDATRSFAERSTAAKTVEVFIRSIQHQSASLLGAERSFVERVQSVKASLLEQALLGKKLAAGMGAERARASEVAESLGWRTPAKGHLRGV